MIAVLLDHLWQSTLLALAVGLVVVALRKAPASARHGLWFAASIKFLIPFSALTALGRLAAPRLPALAPHAPAHSTSPAAFPDAALIERAAQPLARFPLARFTPEPAPPVLQAPIMPAGPGPGLPAAHHAGVHIDPVSILLAVWVLGFGAVLVRWLVRWGRVRRALRAARPLDWPAPMPVLASPTLLEPGLVGVLRPVLVIPESLPERLTRSQIDAILAHEVCHLRRRDNLTAALHTLVEAVFWFHPLVWWIGTRLIAERESACDEAVVREGHDRKTYARSLVESARFYVQSPLSCVAGASGSNLKTRVEAIMNAPPTSPLSGAAKALLLAAGACACATPVAAGLLTPQARQAAAPLVKAVAALSAPARLLPSAPAAAPDQHGAPAMIVLAQNTSVVRPSQSIASPDTAPVQLSQTSAALQTPAASPPAPQPAAPADPQKDAQAFVQSYASVVTGGNQEVVSHWIVPLCVRVTGLEPEQEAAVGTRVVQVAQSLRLAVGRQDSHAKVQRGCFGRGVNVEIGFTDDPRGGAEPTTVTLPIQVRYQTSTTLSANDAAPGEGLAAGRGSNGLKILADYPYVPSAPIGSPGPGGGPPPGSMTGGGPSAAGIYFNPPSPPALRTRTITIGIRGVVVIVDSRRVGTTKLGALADYVALLVLSQSRALDHCQPLPSIADLFAGPCPGRAAPTGLTPADNAYLSALYLYNGRPNSATAPQVMVGPRKLVGAIPETDLVDRMASVLAGPGAVAEAGSARQALPADSQGRPSGRGF
jgi:beta-lactamase regulating signal transducer with metallopeptidase domain